MDENESDVGLIARLSLPVGIGILTILGAVGLIALFIFAPERRDVVIFAAAVVGGAAAVYSAFYAASTLRVAVARDRLARSFEMLNKLNEPSMTDLRVFVQKNVVNDDLNAVELFDLINNDARNLSIVTSVLGTYEDFTIAIQRGLVDERVMYCSAGYMVTWTYQNLRLYIDECRRRDKNPHLYREMESLAQTWQQGKFLSSSDEIPSRDRLVG